MYWFQRLEVFNCSGVERTALSLWLRFQNSRFLPTSKRLISDCLSSQVDSAGKNRRRVSWLGFCSVTVQCFVSGKPTLCIPNNGKTHLNNLQVFFINFCQISGSCMPSTLCNMTTLSCCFANNLMKIRDFVPEKTV